MDNIELSKLMLKINNDRDEIAFSNIFDFIAPKLKAYFLQNGLLSENAEELTQEVLSLVWSKSNKYNPEKSAVSTWIYTIARNKMIDFYRKNKSLEYKEEDIREYLYNPNHSNEIISENEIKDQVDKINKELNDDQRKMIKMNFLRIKVIKK